MLLTPTEAGAHMDALFVDPAAHGQGVGRSLVEHAIARHGAITTDVNAQNPGALGFYRAMGFVETGRSALEVLKQIKSSPATGGATAPRRRARRAAAPRRGRIEGVRAEHGLQHLAGRHLQGLHAEPRDE